MFALLKRSFFSKVFFSYLIVIGLITSVFLAVFFQRVNAESEARAQEEYSEWAEIMRSTFDRKFDDIKTIGIQICNTTWYSHAISTGPYFDEFFTPSSKQQTVGELLRYKAIAGVVDTLVFSLPQRGEIVSSPGWGDASRIMRMIGIKESSDQDILTGILKQPQSQYFEFLNLKSLRLSDSFPYSMAIVQGVDYASLNPRASLLILLNDSMLNNYIEKIKPDNVLGFSIKSRDGDTLFEYRRAGDEEGGSDRLVTVSLPSQTYQCEYEIRLRPHSASETGGLVLLEISAAATLFLLAALISYLLTRLSYRPIANLQRQTETVKQQDEFAGIEGSFRRLEDEKHEIERQMQLYYDAARSNFLLALLRGYFVAENVQEALKNYRIPYDDEQVFRVILCSVPGSLSVASCENLKVFLSVQGYLAERKTPADFVEISATEAALILCGNCGDDEAARNLASGMRRRVQEETGRLVTVCCGTAEKQLLGISKSFQNAKEWITSGSFDGNDSEMLIAGKGSAYYYPTDWEIQLINSLKVGNVETAQKIVSELQVENVNRSLSQSTKIKVTSLVFETVIRVIDELGMDTVEPTREFEENLTQYTDKKQWQYLCTLVDTVCSRVTDPEYGIAGSLGREMVAYVEQNYQNCTLSLKDLSQKFRMSTSAVSRTFKLTAKICFYDYLCRIRMERAKELIRGGQRDLPKTAKESGYENEASFRRAFLRYEGISPHDYINKHNANY